MIKGHRAVLLTAVVLRMAELRPDRMAAAAREAAAAEHLMGIWAE